LKRKRKPEYYYKPNNYYLVTITTGYQRGIKLIRRSLYKMEINAMLDLNIKDLSTILKVV